MIQSVSKKHVWLHILAASIFMAASAQGIGAQVDTPPKFKVLAFYTTANDQGHISYEHEANRWFPKMAKQYGFSYDSTKKWSDCNAANLAKYQVVLFLDNRPEDAAQRTAFKQYMDNGGAWMGFHFAAFALNNSAVPQNWDWYHKEFLGSGEYKSNTWRPTSAILRVEDSTHAFTQGLPATFKASANEWYRWNNDLKTQPNIKILLSIDPTSYPLGTGPKPEEIWHSGYYPVVWTNTKYKMLYANMGHNDIDYEGGSNKDLSQTFSSDIQNKLILNTMLSMGGVSPVGTKAAPKLNAAAAKPTLGIRIEGSRLTVTGNGILEFIVAVYDLHGRKVVEAPTTEGSVAFDRGGLEQGTYVIRLNSAAGKVSRFFTMAGI
jgi:uncharacterized protein